VFKQRFKQFQSNFQKPQVRQRISEMLEAKILSVLFDNYWSDPLIRNLPRECLGSVYWENKLEKSTSALTKMGVGKNAVQLVVDLLSENMNQITSEPPWDNHKQAAQQILGFSQEILRLRFHTSVDQVENTIKPFKFEVECTDLEWKDAQKRASELLTERYKSLTEELYKIKSSIGRSKLRAAIRRVNILDASDSPDVENTSFTPAQLDIARKAQIYSASIKNLSTRIQALKSSQCSTSRPTCCPEIQMMVLSEKLSSQAVLFIQIELLNEFFFQLPRDVDESMYYSLSRPKILEFAKEVLEADFRILPSVVILKSSSARSLLNRFLIN
jgi:dynamin-like GTPase MGM1, mitochondrial